DLVWNGPLDDFLARDSANPGSARILASRTFERHSSSAEIEEKRFRARKSSSPQNAATSTLQACAPQSLTRDYLTRRKCIPLPKSRRTWTSSIKIMGGREHNLKNIDVELPLGVFTCVTGVSGSGKSTLIHDVLYRNLLRAKGQSPGQELGACKSITGAHRINDVVMVDQSPLARTPRSTPVLC